jgi:hypothetical protein
LRLISQEGLGHFICFPYAGGLYFTPTPEENDPYPYSANHSQYNTSSIAIKALHHCVLKSLEHQKNFEKWPHPLFVPKINNTDRQQPNPSRETVLSGTGKSCGLKKFI